ncbi:MAG: hypothetical protein HC877_24240 [Thioploca sp.]|nr:hypothetical protein [Thioploca sp.]
MKESFRKEKWGRSIILIKYPGQSLLILMEEVGEVSKAYLNREPLDNIKKELVQVAAVVVQWLEDLEDDSFSYRDIENEH